MSQKLGMTKEKKLIEVCKVDNKYILEIDGIIIGKFDSAADAERIAKVEMLRSYGLSYEQSYNILDSNIRVEYEFLSEDKEIINKDIINKEIPAKEIANKEIAIKKKDADNWEVYIDGEFRGKSFSRRRAKILANYILISKKHPKWTVKQNFDYVKKNFRG